MASWTELINRDQPGRDVIFSIRLLQLELSQLFNLENLTQSNQRAVTLQPAIAQKYLALAG